MENDYAYIYTWMYIYVHIHMDVQICTYTHGCIYVHIYTWMYIYVHIYTHGCIHTYIYIHIGVYIHTYICKILKNSHTYTQVHTTASARKINSANLQGTKLAQKIHCAFV